MNIHCSDNQFHGAFPPASNMDGNISSDRLTLEGAYVNRHFCIRPTIADLIASLAGLGPDRVVRR